ncbi:hypothetical protein T4E_3890 [Trichinella pseudospiralis]|uniref:Uncharacterized protein n=1 Tax=Trichinella pseudospiralis TaxID=6337 RepID=A0A0V0XM26_TRIPS|nr:hypothetical protein T4E_3890 [Trichinella pseudospiralis]
MLRHRYGDHYLHNEPLAISFRGLELSEDLLLIGRFILIPAHRRFYVPPGKSGSSIVVPAYSGRSPESRLSELFQNHRLFVDYD